jgi:hypothetical protein
MDGAIVPSYVLNQDYVLIDIGEKPEITVTYYYVKCYDDDCNYYEYAGEVDKDDE